MYRIGIVCVCTFRQIEFNNKILGRSLCAPFSFYVFIKGNDNWNFPLNELPIRPIIRRFTICCKAKHDFFPLHYDFISLCAIFHAETSERLLYR